MWKNTGINSMQGRYKIVKRSSNDLYERVTVVLDWERVRKAIKYGGTVY